MSIRHLLSIIKDGAVSLRIQSECGKMQTRITPNTDTFHAGNYTCYSHKERKDSPEGSLNRVVFGVELDFQKQPSRGVLKKRCSENMQKTYL